MPKWKQEERGRRKLGGGEGGKEAALGGKAAEQAGRNWGETWKLEGQGAELRREKESRVRAGPMTSPQPSALLSP